MERVVADICDGNAVDAAMGDVDTVFHTAAIIAPETIVTRSRRARVRAVNVEGTRHVLHAARRHGVARLVYTSSVNAAELRPHAGADETVPPAGPGSDLYSATKAEAERLVLAADGDGLATCALRPGGIYGPGEPHHFPRIVRDVLRGRVRALVDGGRARADNVFIDDLVEAHLAAAQSLVTEDSPSRGRAYFISDGIPQNYFHFFGPTFEQLGVPFPKRSISASAVRPLAAVAEMVHALGGPRPPVTLMELDKLRFDHFFRIDAAARDLGWKPQVGPKEGHARAAAWVQELARRHEEHAVLHEVDRPAVGWCLAIGSGLGLLFLLAYSSTAYAAWRTSVGPMLPQPVLRGIALGAIGLHVGEAAYAFSAARRNGLNASAWSWQTLLVGYPSLRLLLRRIDAEAAKSTSAAKPVEAAGT